MEDPFSLATIKRVPIKRPPPSSCFLPFDPAARNIPLSGKTKVTTGLIWASTALTISSIVINEGIAPLSENPMIGPSIKSVVAMGGMTQALVRSGQWWRIVWAAFLHAGLVHLVLNMLVWICISTLIEPDWGSWRTLFVFCVAALTGNLLSATLDPLNVSVGTSGGIYGLMVATSVYVLEYWDSIPNNKAIFIATVIASLVAIATSFIPYVDAYAHIGGAFGGLVASLMTLQNLDLRHGHTVFVTVSPPNVLPASPGAPRSRKWKDDRLDVARQVEECEMRRNEELGLETTPTQLTVLDTAADDDLPPLEERLGWAPCERCAGFSTESECCQGTPVTLDLKPGRRDHRVSDMGKGEMLLVDIAHGRSPPAASPQHAGDIRMRRSTSMSPSPQQRANPPGSLFSSQVLAPRRRWFRLKPHRSHFVCHIDPLAPGLPSLGKTGFVSKSGVNKIVVNPAASRASIRRTKKLDVCNRYDLASVRAWGARIGAFLALSAVWGCLCYLLFACPECYHAPGQIVQLKKIRDFTTRGRQLIAAEPRILI